MSSAEGLFSMLSDNVGKSVTDAISLLIAQLLSAFFDNNINERVKGNVYLRHHVRKCTV